MKLPFVCETNHYFPEVPATDYNVKIEVNRSLNVAVEIETTLAARTGKGLKIEHCLIKACIAQLFIFINN